VSRRVNLTIGQRLGAGFGVAAVLLAVLVGFSLTSLNRIDAMRHHLTMVIAPRAEVGERLEAAILALGIAARADALVPSPDSLEAYARATREVGETFEALSALPQDPDGVDLVAAMRELVPRHIAASQELVDVAKAEGETDPSRLRTVELAFTTDREALLAPVRGFVALQRRKVAATRAETYALTARIRDAVVGIGAFLLALLGITGWLTARGVRRPALALVHASRRLAAGDFGPAVRFAATDDGRPEPRDELAELSRSFGRMALDLRAREARLAASARLASAMARSLEVARLCRECLDEIVGHLDVEVGSVYLLDDESKLRRRCVVGLNGRDDVLAVGEGIPGRAAQGLRPVVVTDMPADLPFTVRLGVDELPPHTVAAVPMLVQERQAMGVIVVASVRAIAPDAIAFVEHAANQLAVSVQNALAHDRTKALAAELQEKNETLQMQYEEIQAQQEELQAQHEEIQAQNEELQSQNEELQAQQEELQSQGEELQRTVEVLEHSEQHLRRVSMHAPLPVMIYDEDGRVLMLNDAWTRATGYTIDDIATVADWAEKALGEDAADAKAIVTGAIELAGPRTDGTATVRVKDGRRRAWEFHTAPLGFVDDRRLVVTMAVDITDQKHVEEALRAADERKNQFIAVLAHELRNPLAPIRNSVHVLNRAAPGSEQAKRALSVIERQVGHLTRLVDDLLDVARVTYGKIELQTTTVELGALLRQVAEDNEPLFAQRRLGLAVHLPDAGLYVEGDPTRLSQVVGNLLQNAAKFTPAGGRVDLVLDDSAGSARITVRDTGVGMDAETLDRLFEPFVQGDATLARTHGGLGLGLALVSALVKLHGGTVRARSDGYGTGAEFVVELRRTDRIVRLATAHRPLADVPRRILIVEDNADAAESLRDVLALAGHAVAVAHGGRDGIEQARTWRPDVVLCDIGLPDFDGYAVARALRADPALGGVLIVALTGYALAEDVARAGEAGFDAHLAKPPTAERLREVLARASREAASDADAG
jgi:PAS domain S-box-containing protein